MCGEACSGGDCEVYVVTYYQYVWGGSFMFLSFLSAPAVRGHSASAVRGHSAPAVRGHSAPAVRGHGFEFCVFVVGWRNVFLSVRPFVIIVIIIYVFIFNYYFRVSRRKQRGGVGVEVPNGSIFNKPEP